MPEQHVRRVNRIGLVYDLFKETDTSTRICCQKKIIIVAAPLEEMIQRWYRWQMIGGEIQVVFDNLTPPEREFLLTAITPEEWKDLFGGTRESAR